VDIDAQAVEVTKLSLLLKVLEGETGQLSLGFERVLPDLGANIQCGNSLIGPDYYEGKQLGLFNADEMYRINAFDWERAFPAVFAQGGFDAVIGNPPYGAEFLQILQDFLKSKYQTFIWRGESYLLFIEKALDLLRTGGQFSFIIPDTYLNLGFTKILRKLILNTSKVDEIVVLPSNVFAGATVDTTLLFFEKANHTNDYYERDVHVVLHDKKAVIHDVNDPPRKNFVISSKVWWDHGVFMVHSNSKEVKIIEKMEDGNEDLGNIADVFYGIKVYQVGKGKPPQTKDTLKEKPFTSKHKKEGFLPFYNGKNVERYFLNWESNNWIKYGEWVAEPRNPEKFYGEKILMRKIVGKTIISTYVPETSYCNTLLYVIKVNEENSHIDHKYLLGILNSSLFGWYFRMKLQIDETDIFPQILKGNIDKLPINTKADNKKYIIDRVDQMLNLNSQFRVLKTPTEKTQLQRQIDATDAEIDRLVYELYGLTDEEIRIVEESVK
jgi:type I restriction-modification system DNA methylase subunit